MINNKKKCNIKLSNCLILLFFTSIYSCSQLKTREQIAISDEKSAGQEKDLNKFWIKRIISGDQSEKATPIINKASPSNKRHVNKKKRISHIRKVKSKSNFIGMRRSKSVKFWENYLGVKEKERFQRFINNAQKYKHIIEKVFKKYDLPKELFFVGLIESGYYLGAKSHASAVGPWQFIRSTGKMYDLQINSFVDERRSIFKATDAAAQHFKYLYNIFGSWELSLAAYNKGENGIIRRIRRGRTRDYYKLCQKRLLPKETRNYIPKITAAMNIYRNPQKWGLKIPVVKDIYANTTIVPIKRQMSINQISKKFKLTNNQIKSLNSDFIGYYTPRVRSRQKEKNIYTIRIPNNSYSSELLAQINIRDKIKRTPAKRVSRSRRSRRKISRKNYKTSKTFIYTIKRGDNLFKLSTLFNVKISIIKRKNNLRNSRVYIGQRLTIPGFREKTYTVRRGDNLNSIARKFKTKLASLRKINGLKSSKIYPGQKITIARSL
jgi:membrane-bound lytic murein transglycosylase D